MAVFVLAGCQAVPAVVNLAPIDDGDNVRIYDPPCVELGCAAGPTMPAPAVTLAPAPCTTDGMSCQP